jgi:hypothetical protein
LAGPLILAGEREGTNDPETILIFGLGPGMTAVDSSVPAE